MKKKLYRTALRALQIELVKLQRHFIGCGDRILVILEGRDAAGKDGAIKRIIEHLSPRETRVVALGKPSDRDRSAWYFQRYVAHLPVAGEFVLFNRSWYNRAGVERVMGYCTKDEFDEFMETVVGFEQMLVRSGVKLGTAPASGEARPRPAEAMEVEPGRRQGAQALEGVQPRAERDAAPLALGICAVADRASRREEGGAHQSCVRHPRSPALRRQGRANRRAGPAHGVRVRQGLPAQRQARAMRIHNLRGMARRAPEAHGGHDGADNGRASRDDAGHGREVTELR